MKRPMYIQKSKSCSHQRDLNNSSVNNRPNNRSNPLKRGISFRGVKERLKEVLSEGEADLFRGGWERIGDVLIIELPEELESKKLLIGKEMHAMFPKIKTILNRKGITSKFREPEIEIISGKDTLTVHKENSCLFKIDPTKVMFCAGNLAERARMAAISGTDETVLDMFSGIGQFTIPMARHSNPRKIFSIEKNPVAFRFLNENVKLNKLDNVETILGDCREVSPRGVADRVVMGYFVRPERFLRPALAALNGRGVIHYHDLPMRNEVERRADDLISTINSSGYDAQIITARVVKSYSPARVHCVFDVECSRRDGRDGGMMGRRDGWQ